MSLDYTIAASYANFGHIPYGRSIIGRIYFSKSNPDGCKEFENGEFKYTDDPDNVLSPIILVER